MKRIFQHAARAALPMTIAVTAALMASAAAGPGIDIPQTISIPAGPFIRGSDRAEREYAYRLDEDAYGHRVTRERKWYENETRKSSETGAYRIAATPITNAQYAAFIASTGHPWPDVDEATWNGYRLVHPYSRSRRHAWKGPVPPADRENHPVVMVSVDDARAYAAWLSDQTGERWRLPDEGEWEKAMRGDDGRYFPWGNEYDPARLNSHDLGPFDTMPVGAFANGRSPYGVLDGAGQVFEWTSTSPREGRYVVKGGSWDDKGCGVCRPASRHTRPQDIKHILVGFRLVLETAD